AIAGPDPHDPTCLSKPFVYPELRATAAAKAGRKKFKIGVIKGSTDLVQPEVKKNFEAALDVLRPLAEVVEDVPFPDLPFSEVINLIVKAEGASALRDLIERGRTQELRDPRDRWGGEAGSMVLAVDYLQALRLRGPMKRALDALYAPFDALMAPSLPTVSTPVSKDFRDAY